MARHGRSYPIRAVTIIQAVRPLNAPDIDLGPFVTANTFPALAVEVPDANVALGAFVTANTFPALTVSAGFSQTVSLGAFVTPNTFPTLGVSVPLIPGARMTGVDGEIQWTDTVWTPGGIYSPLDLEGWDDLPGITAGDEEKPQQHGAWAGLSFADPRLVSVTIWVRDDSPTWQASLKALRRATPVPVDETEYPLVIQTRGERLMAWARIRNRIVPQDLIGIGTSEVALQWVCADPRRYGMEEYTADIAAGQTMGIANDGDAPTSPTLVFRGPVVLPRVTWAEQSLAFNVTLSSGQTLTVDTRLGTAEWSTGAFAPTDDFSVPIEEWYIPADGADVTYEPDSGGANGMTLTWRHATW
jgi:hypothetical protein